jgi:hypothetical protein
MNHTNNWEARPGGGVGNRGPATVGVPAQDLAGLNLGRYLDRPVLRSLFLHGDGIRAAAWRQ